MGADRIRTTARITGAVALLVAAAVHVAQFSSIFHAVPTIGPLFVADAVASTAIALALLANRRRAVAGLGALVSAGALAALAISSIHGLFGWQEVLLRPSVKIAIASELVALATLLPLALPSPPHTSPDTAVRAAIVAGLVAVGVLHLAAAPEEWGDTRGIFWLFVALAAACLALAVRTVEGLDRWTAPGVIVLAAAAVVGYVLSRTVGLPGDQDDVGDWGNALGLAALAVELGLIAVAVTWRRGRVDTNHGARRPAVALPALRRRSTRRRPATP